MNEWYGQILTVVDEIDACIRRRDDESLTLNRLSRFLGYSKYHTTRKFHAISGVRFRDYLQRRRLAFALIEVRDAKRRFLDIAVDHGFSSHEAFTRAFKRTYGITPAAYRKNPAPIALRTTVSAFDRYTFGIGEIGMVTSSEDIKVYFVTIPAHKFLYIKNYESDGYFDFWAKQDLIPGQDCDAICALLDGINGKLDGEDGVSGQYSGQIMGYLREADGRCPECYGVRLAADDQGPVPEGMLMTDVAEGEYIVFEHGPFDYEADCGSAGEALERAMDAFDFGGSEYLPDETPGRIGYFYHDPERFVKQIRPVRRK